MNTDGHGCEQSEIYFADLAILLVLSEAKERLGKRQKGSAGIPAGGVGLG
jgi:hypothetical protein